MAYVSRFQTLVFHSLVRTMHGRRCLTITSSKDIVLDGFEREYSDTYNNMLKFNHVGGTWLYFPSLDALEDPRM